jgi:hypothetical protein
MPATEATAQQQANDPIPTRHSETPTRSLRANRGGPETRKGHNRNRPTPKVGVGRVFCNGRLRLAFRTAAHGRGFSGITLTSSPAAGASKKLTSDETPAELVQVPGGRRRFDSAEPPDVHRGLDVRSSARPPSTAPDVFSCLLRLFGPRAAAAPQPRSLVLGGGAPSPVTAGY